MTPGGARTFVGFGFGAIQAGLFLYEAYRSDAFRRLVVAEIDPIRAARVRGAGGYYGLNIAHHDHVESLRIGPIEIYNPTLAEDRAQLTAAVAEADELATAIPSVAGYASAGPGSIHRVLAAGLAHRARSGGPPQLIYTAENDKRAAERLADAVGREWPAHRLGRLDLCVCFVNTVIGKMSGVVPVSEQLVPITQRDRTAFLVEAFNRIFISQVHFGGDAAPPGWERGLTIFREKADLAPFEEAKLYGHNAVHALAAYLGAAAGIETMPGLARLPGFMRFLRDALLLESGVALRRKYGPIDPLFTEGGFQSEADDLLARMINPYLCDSIERVARDPARKLGWNDRLIGAMRLAIENGIRPVRYALGAAAALEAYRTEEDAVFGQAAGVRSALQALWRQESPPDEVVRILANLIEEGRERLRAWRQSGFGDLEMVSFDATVKSGEDNRDGS